MNKIAIALIAIITLVLSCKTDNKAKTKLSNLSTPFSEEEKIDSANIKKLFNTALTKGKSYEWLRELTSIGGRLSGSEQATKAVYWGVKVMNEVGLDSVWLQPVMVPHWVRGEKEQASYNFKGNKINVPICALGFSVATPVQGVTAQVIEVKSIEQAEKLGSKAKGKIIFYNGAFDNKLINTFEAYSGCVSQRFEGAATVGKLGAVGVIVRSMGNRIDDYPHTGSMSYKNLPKNQYIPAAAISTRAAENLSKHLKENPNLKFYFKQSCKTLADAPSFNVVGEIKGVENPDKILVVGGHLDSWDLGDGAHDDGTGIVQSLEVAYLFKQNNIKPKNTLRVVFFMNEENGLRGATEYQRLAKENREIHIGALESDAGGHTPRGFSINANQKNLNLLQSWKKLLAPYGLHDLIKGFAGADISPLKEEHVTLVGYRPDSQRYFDYHHTEIDTFDKVNKRELELGSSSMASIVYLMDKYLHFPNTLKP
ncbi:MAG: M20/M25/M40 family metallo-hydrolase [Tenacibaculum sp.]